MSEPFLAEVSLFGFNYAPRGWALCDGQILPINQNQALYSLLGTTYGGDGETTFGLPELRGRVPIHVGPGHTLGSKGGEESHTLLESELPSHSHNLRGSSARGNSETPGGKVLAKKAGTRLYATGPAPDAMDATSLEKTGNSNGHNNLQPYTVVNFAIALQGLFPSQ